MITDRKQSASINGFNSDISIVTFGVPEGSVLEPLLSFIYINDLNLAIKHCQIHHFADETGLLNINKSQNVLINSLISTQQNIFKCLKNKTGFLKRKSMDFNLKRKLNGKWLSETNSVKYLGIRIDSKLNWKAHIDDIALKLITANAMLYKVRDFVNAGSLKAIYHALF